MSGRLTAGAIDLSTARAARTRTLAAVRSARLASPRRAAGLQCVLRTHRPFDGQAPAGPLPSAASPWVMVAPSSVAAASQSPSSRARSCRRGHGSPADGGCRHEGARRGLVFPYGIRSPLRPHSIEFTDRGACPFDAWPRLLTRGEQNRQHLIPSARLGSPVLEEIGTPPLVAKARAIGEDRELQLSVTAT